MDEIALRRSEGSGIADLDGWNRECCPCFRLFKADLLEIANSRSVNAVPGLGICK